jgi:hypothetical protein
MDPGRGREAVGEDLIEDRITDPPRRIHGHAHLLLESAMDRPPSRGRVEETRMDEIDRPLPGPGTATTESNEPARSDASAGDTRKEEGTERTAADERPLFTTTDDIDPELSASGAVQGDLQPRGVGVSGVLGDVAGPAAAVVPDLSVATPAGETAGSDREERADRAPDA